MYIVLLLLILCSYIISADAFQNLRKCGSWQRIEQRRSVSVLYLDSSKRAVSQIFKLVESNVGSKAMYLTDKTKDKFLDAAVKLTRGDQKLQRALFDYALQQYTRNPVNSAVVRALLIAVPLSLAGGAVLHSWWRYLIDYVNQHYEIGWADDDSEDGSDSSRLNPRLLPPGKLLASPVTAETTAALAALKSEKKWFHRLSGWFGGTSASDAAVSSGDDGAKSSDGTAAASGAGAAPVRRTYTEEEYEKEVGNILRRVEETLLRDSSDGGEHFSEVERSAVLRRLAVILYEETAAADRDLAVDLYSSVMLYSEFWREFLDREVKEVDSVNGMSTSEIAAAIDNASSSSNRGGLVAPNAYFEESSGTHEDNVFLSSPESESTAVSSGYEHPGDSLSPSDL